MPLRPSATALKASAVDVEENNASFAARIPRPSQHVSRNVLTTLAVDVEENNASCAEDSKNIECCCGNYETDMCSTKSQGPM